MDRLATGTLVSEDQCVGHALVAAMPSSSRGIRCLHSSGWPDLGFPPTCSFVHAIAIFFP